MSDYLTPDSPDAHLDWPGRVTPEGLPEGWYVCPKCGGWGGHNLIANAYPLPDGKLDEPENRHKYCHFRCSCDQCSGAGRVTVSDATCVHEWRWVRNRGRCLNEWECTKCPLTRIVDSSD